MSGADQQVLSEIISEWVWSDDGGIAELVDRIDTAGFVRLRVSIR